MKHLLLTCVMALLAISASAVSPKGTPAYYSSNGYVFTIFGPFFSEGTACQIYQDADTLYVPIFPATSPDVFCKGIISEDGKTVKFSKNELVGQKSGYDLYLADYFYGDPSSDDPSDTIDVVLQIEGNTLFIADNETAPTHYFSLDGYKEGALEGTLDLTALVSFTKLEVQPELVSIPATAIKKDYIYSGVNTYAEKMAKRGHVYQDGNDVYFDCFGGFDGVCKGTIEGNKCRIAKNQFLGVTTYFLYTGAFKTEWETDEEGNYYGEILDEFVLDYDAATGTFSSSDPTIYQMAFNEAGLFVDGMALLTIEAYEGDKPAIPSDPFNLSTYDLTEDYGQYCLSGTVSNFDADGNYINPDKIEVAIIEDGDYLTLTAGDGYSISQDYVWVPAGFTDNEGGVDLMFREGAASFYLYESLFDQLGLQARYTVDGVTYYSNIVYYSEEGDIVIPVDHTTGVALPTAIATLNANASAKSYFNLYGQQMRKAQRGLNIINGKKRFVK